MPAIRMTHQGFFERLLLRGIRCTLAKKFYQPLHRYPMLLAQLALDQFRGSARTPWRRRRQPPYVREDDLVARRKLNFLLLFAQSDEIAGCCY
jgi:hypothetical protein